ncbi:hypothetical protein NST48_12595 [Paenibacillus sp. FSL M7-0547]|uniref:DUF7446 family protein n=1 Tax=Paenibacillus sp. FSL M7-0547 TaxID=2954755 RepID=UPI0030FCDD91
MSTDLVNLKVWCSPVTGIIYAGFENNGVASKKVEVTKQVVDAVIHHMDVTNRDYECAAGDLIFKKTEKTNEKGDDNVQNSLVVWLNKTHGETAESTIKGALKRDFNIDEHDLESDENGFEFLFDDETGGKARIDFIQDDKNAFGIKVSGDHSWECIQIYELIQGSFDDDSEV